MTDTKIQEDQHLTSDEIDCNFGVDELIELPDYELRISRDRVCIELDCPDPHAEVDELIENILTDFERLEIPEFPDAEILKSILATSCEQGQYLRAHVIMMGQKAIPQVDGKLEWSKDYFAEGWAVDEESGNIDFWSKMENRSVREDEVLVKLYHPVEGTEGLNVFGAEISVSKPGSVKLRSGKNVRVEEGELYNSYIATCNGRVRLSDGTVSIDDVYVVSGNVSLETGNITHTGAVMIQGDVGSGASIDVEGDIMVKGMVEPCNIKCGGSLTVAGGIVGDEENKLEITGDLLAKYISETNIEVQGDVIVGNEIAHSHVSCLGRVKVPKGRIAGGTTTAKKGIQLAEAGSSGSSDTKLIAGVDYTLPAKIHWHEEKINKLEEAQEKVGLAVQMNQRKQGQTKAELETYEGLKIKNNHISQAIADEHMLIQKLKIDALNTGLNEIVILNELWSGTKITLAAVTMIVRSSILKPRIVKLERKKIKILPLGDANMPDD